jgi:hypothetical protein
MTKKARRALKVLVGLVILSVVLYLIGIGQETEREIREETSSLPANIIINEKIIEGKAWIVSQGDGIRESFVSFKYNNKDYRLLVPTSGVVECLEILDIQELESKKKTLVNYKIRKELPRYTSQCDNQFYWSPSTEIDLKEHYCDQRVAIIKIKKM